MEGGGTEAVLSANSNARGLRASFTREYPMNKNTASHEQEILQQFFIITK
jgi:hypothetical protein